MRKSVLTTIILIFQIFSLLFGVGGGVYAAAETETSDSAIMRELSRLTIGGAKFNVEDYPADEEGTPQLLYLNENGYGYTAAKQVAYGLILYIYNPAQLNIVQDVRNTVQMKIGNAERYSKYALSVIEGSADKLFYKLSVSFTAEEKSAALSAMGKDSRRYEVSSFEFYLEGFNATSFDISPTRVFTYTGYAAGLGESGESTLTNTLSYTEAGGTETIPLEVKHTSWRPEGTNGRTAWTQDTIHSVYFAVPKAYDEQYDYLKSVQVQWLKARLAPVYITNNKSLADDLIRLYLHNIATADILGEKTYNGITEYSCGAKPFEWALLTYPIKESALAPVESYSLYFGFDEYYKDVKNLVEKRVNDLSLFFYSEKISATEYCVTSNELTQLIKDRTEEIKSTFRYSTDICYPVANKYPAHLFSDWDSDFTTKIIKTSKANEGEEEKENENKNETIVTADKLNLNSEEVKTSFWNKVFGGTTVENQQKYKPIDAIQVITDSDVAENKSPQEISSSLYISERDAEDFRTFYNNNSATSTVYLMRYAISEYWAQPTNEYKKEGYKYYPKKGEGYFAQETCYLDFDIIDFEYVKEGKSYVIPVSMSPIDIFPELTPPPKYDDDFWKYGVGIMVGLIVFYVVYKIASKVVRGVKAMVGSFIVLALVFVLRLTLGSLTDRFSWMSKVLPYVNYGIYGALALFALFTLLTLIRVIFGGRKSNRR